MKTLMVALLLLLLAPVAASAASAFVVAGPSDPRDPPVRFRFGVLTDVVGERNHVELRRRGAGRVALRDLGGAPVTAGSGCAAAADGWVECETDEMRVGLAAGDDVLRLFDGVVADANGGDGDDRLHAGDGWARSFDGGPGDDEVVGDPGVNRLAAGPGTDRLSGGAGDDLLLDYATYANQDGTPIRYGGGERDIFDGGAGRDTVSYAARTDDLTIDLRAGRGPDGDVLRSIEGAIAGSGDDTIIGAELDEPVSCGPGDDRVVATAQQEIAFPGRDCERIETRLLTLTKLETTAKRLRLSARATYPARSRLCGLRGSVRSADGGRMLARVAVRIPNRARRTVTLTSSRALPARIAVELRPQRCDGRGRMSADPAQRALRFPYETR